MLYGKIMSILKKTWFNESVKSAGRWLSWGFVVVVQKFNALVKWKRWVAGLLIAVIALGTAAGLGSCLTCRHGEYGDTLEFRAFLAEKKARPLEVGGISVNKTGAIGQLTVSLHDGVLRFVGDNGKEIWRSSPYWFVDSFALQDVNGDGDMDCLFSLWKSYSFYEGSGKPDSPAVRNHLFLYTVRCGRLKPLWCSSNLPRPFYNWCLRAGKPDKIASQAVLKTVEGEYTNDFHRTRGESHTYFWSGWGFTEDDGLYFSRDKSIG